MPRAVPSAVCAIGHPSPYLSELVVQPVIAVPVTAVTSPDFASILRSSCAVVSMMNTLPKPSTCRPPRKSPLIIVLIPGQPSPNASVAVYGLPAEHGAPLAGNTPPVIVPPDVEAPPATVEIVFGSAIGAWEKDDAPASHATARAPK